MVQKEYYMTTQNNTPKETYSKTNSKPRISSADRPSPSPTSRASRPSTSRPIWDLPILLPILFVVGSILLSASCAPATSPTVDGGGGNHPSAPTAVTGIAVDEESIESSSFLLQWLAPTTTGTSLDGIALDPTEVGYRIYYLAGTADEAVPRAEPIQKNPDTQTQELKGVLQARIMELTPKTRYFVMVASYNSFATHLEETISDEVIEVSTGEATPDLDGSLSYAETTHEFTAGFGGSITPASTPSVPDAGGGAGSGTTINYDIAFVDGTEFAPAPAIDDSGIITIASTTGEGKARYLVRATATDYTTQTVTLTITIIENLNAGLPLVGTYYSNVGETTDLVPVELGQAIEDDGTLAFTLANDDVVLSISDLTDGDFTIHFGTAASGEANSYSGSYSKTAVDNTITILKSDLTKDPSNSFSFTDGAVIGISGPGIIDTEHVATYRPSNIYNHQDLQAMRKNPSGSYVLTRNIVFPSPTGTDTANYEAVGTVDDPFAGSLDGADGASGADGNNTNYSITGIQIESAEDYQGLFGVIEASTVDTVVAQNLVLRDFKITGNTRVGSLVGWIKKGTIDNVRVEVNSADAGKVEVTGNIMVGTSNRSYGGGLVGRAGTDTTGTQVKIQNTSSAVAVVVSGTASNVIGGLVGYMSNSVLTDSFATGPVTGYGVVGGLVGWNKGGAVTGYATGTVTGFSSIGGLVSYNDDDGTVTGYATGDVIGSGVTGGLVGWNVSGTVIGYATGTVTGSGVVGGLAGENSSTATIVGYARGAVRRVSGSEVSFGKTIGTNTGTLTTYSSMFENQIYSEETGTSVLTGTTGADGTAVSVGDSTIQDVFSGFTFGIAVGEWTWVADGKWPAINIGDELKPASEQPTETCIFAESASLCQTISKLPSLQIGVYHSMDMGLFPVEIGQAAADVGTFTLADDAVIITVAGLMDEEHTIHFGSDAENYSGTHRKEASGSDTVTILKSDLMNSDLMDESFSFVDGAVIGISSSTIEGILQVATYRPSNIYTRQDLQGMRAGLGLDYVLRRNIEFTPSTDTSNYEAVGNSSAPFTGSLDGAGYTIMGVKIGSGDYQGLFGVMEASETDDVLVQNLVLRNFKIEASAVLGSLAGWIKRGTVDNVSVTASDINAGKVVARGHIFASGLRRAEGGGLVGRAEGPGIRIKNTNSSVTVSGTGLNSHSMGGLVGYINNNVVLSGSYATGAVTGKGSLGGLVGRVGSGTIENSYATGRVMGSSDNAGGLVGASGGSVAGYATGDVSGNNSVGGLVGAAGGSVAGYATGNETGNNNVGGLVGYNNDGTVIGYATGNVSGGGTYVGGLVGWNVGSGTATGYATGSVIGNKNVGGLIGKNNSSSNKALGYVRGVVRRRTGPEVSFGKTIGTNVGTEVTYNSMSKSKIYDGETGTTVLTGTTGIDGTTVNSSGFNQGTFSGLTFGTDIGKWTWVSNSKWPAINIGEVKPANGQPINR